MHLLYSVLPSSITDAINDLPPVSNQSGAKSGGVLSPIHLHYSAMEDGNAKWSRCIGEGLAPHPHHDRYPKVHVYMIIRMPFLVVY